MGKWSSLRGGLISVKTLMGILIVWSLKFCVLDFWICRDLPSNSILSKIKLCSFFLAQHLIYIKNFFYTIVDQPKGFHLEKFNNWGQNSYGRRTIWSLISSDFLVLKNVKKVLPTSFTDFPHLAPPPAPGPQKKCNSHYKAFFISPKASSETNLCPN